MTQFAFGSGMLIGKRTDVTNTPPALLGTLADISIEFDRKLETLLGQYGMAVAIGGGEFKITGKAKFARLEATQLNNLFLGQTLTANSSLEMATGEAGTVPGTAPFTVTVANSSTFTEDFGVFYASTGVQFVPVASGPAQGQYSVANGVYTFSSADAAAAVLIYYQYAISTGNKIALANQLMGPVPVFEVALKESFTYFGAVKDLVVKLNACASSKLSLPFSNQKFAIAEFDFQAFADASNNIGTIGMTE